MLSHRNLTDNAVCLDMRIPAGTVSMTLLPINHVYCLTMDIIKGLYIGMIICINDSIMHVAQYEAVQAGNCAAGAPCH